MNRAYARLLVRVIPFVLGAALLLLACTPRDEASPTTPRESATSTNTGTSTASTASGTMDESGPSRPTSRVGRLIEAEISGAFAAGSVAHRDALLTAGPVISDNLLLTGDADGLVRATTLEGADAWERYLGEPIVAVAAIENAVYSAAGSVLARLDPVGGAVVWQSDALRSPISARLTATRASVFVGMDDGTVAAFDAQDGAQRWQLRLPRRVVDRMALVDGVLYLASEDGTVVAISAIDGSEAWRAAAGESVHAGPSVTGATIGIATVSGSVAVISTDGTPVSTWDSGLSPVLASPLPSAESIVVCGADGMIRSFTKTGEQQWQYRLPADLAATPMRFRNAVVVADSTGTIVSIDTRTGVEIARGSIGAMPAGEAAAMGTRLFFRCADGSVRTTDVNAERRDVPLFDSQGSWVLPENGVFRLRDRRVALRMRSERDAVFSITVSSAPSEDLVLQVDTDSGDVVATNMGKVTLDRSIRVALDAGVSYQLLVSRSSPGGEITVTVTTRQLE